LGILTRYFTREEKLKKSLREAERFPFASKHSDLIPAAVRR